MNRNVLILPLILLMTFIGGLGAFAAFESFAGDKTLDASFLTQSRTPKDLVVLDCAVGSTTGGVTGSSIVTKAFSNSANAPSVPLDANCAQSLADLLEVGFNFADDSGGDFFTLEREAGARAP